MGRGKLITVIGATGVGKSAYALQLAKELNTEIVSADSRQIYRGMVIGTDAPSQEDRATVPHHFVQCREITEPYSAYQYAEEALALLDTLLTKYPVVVAVGGSMMYLQALLYEMDEVPLPSSTLREALWERFHEEGVVPLREELQKVDPDYLARIDPNNHKRIIRALEVYHTTGRPFSSFHTTPAPRQLPFEVELRMVTRPREELYERINRRVEQMVAKGLVKEVRSLLPYREYNALNTIGYKEIFQYLDGDISLEEATRLIAKHSRTYARQQIAFFSKWQGTEVPLSDKSVGVPFSDKSDKSDESDESDAPPR